MKTTIPVSVLSLVLPLMLSTFLSAQSPLPNYPLKFQFRDGRGTSHDTMLSRIKYKYWSKSSTYPSYVKWKNEPFAVLRSPLNGVGLFTDSASSFSAGDTIGYAFYKRGVSGKFDLDYVESNIGSFVNNTASPNMDVVLTAQGILLKANQTIGPNTELTASYQAIINFFPNDKSVRRVIQYW